MAASAGAIVLLLAAAAAIILVVRTHKNALALCVPGDPRPPLMTRANRFITMCVVVALVVAPLLFVPDFGWWGVVPFLLCLVMATVLVSMAIDWPDGSFGESVHTFIWGEAVTDPTVDPRLDPTSSDYDPQLDPSDPAFDEQYFASNAIVPWNSRKGILVYLMAGALNLLCLLIAAIVAGIMAIGGVASSPEEGAAAAPSPTATTATPSPGATSAAPKGDKPTGRPAVSKVASTLDRATCKQVRETLVMFPAVAKPIGPGVQICIKDKWDVWVGAPAEGTMIDVTHSQGVGGGWLYMLANIDGKDVLIRI